MLSRNTPRAFVPLVLWLGTGPALAHITLLPHEARPSAPYRAVLGVTQGCDGPDTTRLRVSNPEGVIAVKPMQQECGNRFARWVETPAPGQNARDLKFPAPSIRLATETGAEARGRTTVKAGGLVIESPWARATPGGAKVGGGYLKITNTGAEPDRLIGGSFPVSARFEVHEMAQEGDVMRMRQIPQGLEIMPGQTVELKPGGLHIMFMELREPLKEGQSVRGTLRFEKAGSVEIGFAVGPIGGAQAPQGAPHAGH